MREILFRGKNRDGVWLYGDLRQNANAIETDGIDLGGDMFIEPHKDSDTLYSPDSYVVDPSTVGQFTGLRDRNGVRIFEGDIVGYVPYWNTGLKLRRSKNRTRTSKSCGIKQEYCENKERLIKK